VDIPVHRAVNLESMQLMTTITNIVTTMAQYWEARYLAEGRVLKDFYSHNSDNFDGCGDHFSPENWLNYTEELLDTIACIIEQKVKYFTYRLTGEVKRWWQPKNGLLILDLGSEYAIT
jgi:hypothetical protein